MLLLAVSVRTLNGGCSTWVVRLRWNHAPAVRASPSAAAAIDTGDSPMLFGSCRDRPVSLIA